MQKCHHKIYLMTFSITWYLIKILWIKIFLYNLNFFDNFYSHLSFSLCLSLSLSQSLFLSLSLSLSISVILVFKFPSKNSHERLYCGNQSLMLHSEECVKRRASMKSSSTVSMFDFIKWSTVLSIFSRMLD